MNTVICGVISPSEIVLSDTELSARLAKPASIKDEYIRAVCDEIFEVANIRFVATRLQVICINGSAVDFDGFSVDSRSLSAYLCGCGQTYIFAVTLGSEVDRLIMKKKARSAADLFIFDAVASAVIEGACDAAEHKIHQGVKTKNRFSPGYADCPLSLQKDILSRLSADKYAGIKLLDSLLMSPMKSVSAFAAILP